MRYLLFILFLYTSTLGLAWQPNSAVNPFDLEWRIPAVVDSTGAATVAYTGAKNPFDVVPHATPSNSQTATNRSVSGPRSGFGWLKGRYSEPKGMLFGVVVVLLMFLSVAVSLGRSAISKAWNAFANHNQFALILREWVSGQIFPSYLLLYINFILNLGFFVYLAIRFWSDGEIVGIRVLLASVIGVLLLYFAKHLTLWILGALFPINKETTQYDFLVASGNVTMGFFLLPINLILAFSSGIEGFLIFWVISLFVIYFIFRAIRSLGIGGKYLYQDKFHFLLYLCAVELMPMLILGKMILSVIN